MNLLSGLARTAVKYRVVFTSKYPFYRDGRACVVGPRISPLRGFTSHVAQSFASQKLCGCCRSPFKAAELQNNSALQDRKFLLLWQQIPSSTHSPSVISVRSVVEIFTTEASETTEHKMQRRAAHQSYGVLDGTVFRLRLRRPALPATTSPRHAVACARAASHPTTWPPFATPRCLRGSRSGAWWLQPQTPWAAP